MNGRPFKSPAHHVTVPTSPPLVTKLIPDVVQILAVVFVTILIVAKFGYYGPDCSQSPSFLPLYLNGPDALGIVPSHSNYGAIGATYEPFVSGASNIVTMEVSGKIGINASFELTFYRFPGAEPLTIPVFVPVNEFSNGPKVRFPVEINLPHGPASNKAYFELKLISTDPSITNLPKTRTTVPFEVVVE